MNAEQAFDLICETIARISAEMDAEFWTDAPYLLWRAVTVRASRGRPLRILGNRLKRSERSSLLAASKALGGWIDWSESAKKPSSVPLATWIARYNEWEKSPFITKYDRAGRPM